MNERLSQLNQTDFAPIETLDITGMVLPQAGDYSLLEKGTKGFKLSKAGREANKENWDKLIGICGTDDIDLLKQTSDNLISALSENNDLNQDYIKKLKRSFAGKIRYQERKQFWSEMEESRSPWVGVAQKVQENVYPQKRLSSVKNTTYLAIQDIKKQIEESMVINPYDDKKLLVDKHLGDIGLSLSNKLDNLSDAELAGLNQTGLRKGLIELIRTPSQRPQIVEQKVQQSLPQVSEIKAQDITVENQKRGLREILSAFKERISNIKFKIDKKRLFINLGISGTLSIGAMSAVYAKNNWSDIQNALNNKTNELKEYIGDFDNIITETLGFTEPTPYAEKDEFGIYLPHQTVTETHNIFPSPSPTQTETPEPTFTPEPTPIQNPFELGGIDFSQELKTYINFAEKAHLNFSFTPVHYDYNYTEEQAGLFNSKIKPGKETAGVYTDKYGNIIVVCHSGVSGISENECEALRQDIEGGSALNRHRDANEDEIKNNLLTYVGKEITIYQEDDIPENYKITAAGYVPHELNDRFVSNAWNSTDVLIEATGGPDSPFKDYAGKSRTIFIQTCGRPDKAQSGAPGWYVWSKLVFALEPVDEYQNSIQSSSEIEVTQSPTEAVDLNEVVREKYEVESFSDEAKKDPYVQKVEEVVNILNQYPKDQPEESWTIGVGSYIRDTDFYRQLTEAQKQKLEKALPLLDAVTYREQGRAIECLWFEDLLFHLDFDSAPKINLGAFSIERPGEVIERNLVSEKSLIFRPSIDEIKPGHQIIWADHVSIVVSAWDSEAGRVIELVDANKKKDGQLKIFKLIGQDQLNDYLGKGTLLASN